MKKKFIAIIAIAVLVVTVCVAFAGAPNTPSLGRVPINKTVAKKAKSACTTITAGRASTAQVPVTQTSMIDWKAFSATDGTAVVVKRSFDSNTAYMPASSESGLPIEPLVSNVTFTRYSGATTVTVCSDRN